MLNFSHLPCRTQMFCKYILWNVALFYMRNVGNLYISSAKLLRISVVSDRLLWSISYIYWYLFSYFYYISQRTCIGQVVIYDIYVFSIFSYSIVPVTSKRTIIHWLLVSRDTLGRLYKRESTQTWQIARSSGGSNMGNWN